MALIVCPECGKEFSDKAKRCPQCACPIEYVLSVLQKEVDIDNVHETEVEEEIDFLSIFESKNIKMWNQGLLGKAKVVSNYIKDERMTKVVNVLSSLDEYSKEFKDMSIEYKEHFFNDCIYDNQVLIDMNYSGCSRDITVYNREWRVQYRGSSYFGSETKNASLKNMRGNEIFSISACDPNEYKWEIFPTDKYNTMMERAEIYFRRSSDLVLSSVFAIKKEKYKLSKLNWIIEIAYLKNIVDIYDSKNNHIGRIHIKLLGKTSLYIIDYNNNSITEKLIALAMALDICRSSYEPENLQDKSYW